ncbi:alanine or glycine:cation symporter, AGCS family [Ferrimonas sediminum]|uniref:Alanine or glycine:cation symporter, AGCS family n=1 Tax=Ferrimonas sediminum TaxID=718193 RepID=A0A1G8ZAV2_9GAMM|nr:alanine/glycine:cation symporter family protein [Ferrimonas sediminum]SDK12148.1 alanine or glycine:cation symporter, AGCS family [Ferrimonas sediminum]
MTITAVAGASALEAVNDVLATATGAINSILWNHILIYLLVFAGLFFTVRLGFIQFRRLGHGFHSVFHGRETEHGISSFQVFCTSMAARVGTGNMAGIAVAIVGGGPGAIFWMWVIALLGMSTAFVEATLAQLFKVEDEDGFYRGGPAFYMEKGLGQRWMGILFSIFLIIAFGFVFNAVQANTIAGAIGGAFGIDTVVLGLIMVVATGLIIVGGLKKVAHASEIIVPIMAVVYLAVALVVVLMNLDKVPAALGLIIDSAFGLEQFAGGALGALIIGAKRGLFSNEAGMGSAASVAASANPNPKHPASQGFIQMTGVFVDTIVICTASAAIILLSGVLDNPGDASGIGLLQLALTNELGGWASYFIAFAIILFSFSSIIANYSYAENNIMFLNGNTKKGLMLFRLAVLSMVMFGAMAKVALVWDMADASMGLMAVVNIVAVLALSGLAIKLAKDYVEQLDAGKTPSFDPARFPELKGKLAKGVWDK